MDIGNRYRLGIEGMLEVGDGVGNCEKPSQSVGDGAVPPPRCSPSAPAMVAEYESLSFPLSFVLGGT